MLALPQTIDLRLAQPSLQSRCLCTAENGILESFSAIALTQWGVAQHCCVGGAWYSHQPSADHLPPSILTKAPLRRLLSLCVICKFSFESDPPMASDFLWSISISSPRKMGAPEIPQRFPCSLIKLSFSTCESLV